MKAFRSPLMLQLALIISLLILTIEGIILFTSLESKRSELNGIRNALNKQVMANSGKMFEEIHPGILDRPDIERRMKGYTQNIIFLTLLITIVVAIGSMIIFYNRAGRYLVKLKSLNLTGNVKVKTLARYPVKKLPNNEIGDLIRSREEMLDRLQDYEDNLEERLKEAQDRLIQTAKLSLVGEFTAGIVHDIKNPLTVILTYSQLLKNSEKRQSMDPEKVDRNIEKINLSAQKLHKLVDRMGRFNRTQESFKEDTSLNEIIENSLLFTESKIKAVGIKVTKIIPPGLTLYGDENSLEQVLTNLFSNACDAMEGRDKRELTIFVDEMNNKIILEVSDTGTGMDDETVNNAFNSFFTTKPEGKGTGLGLANVAEIISKHNGEINVDSEKGQGTTFILILNKFAPKANQNDSKDKISA